MNRHRNQYSSRDLKDVLGCVGRLLRTYYLSRYTQEHRSVALQLHSSPVTLRDIIGGRCSLDQHPTCFAAVWMCVSKQTSRFVSNAVHDIAVAMGAVCWVQFHGLEILLPRVSVEALLGPVEMNVTIKMMANIDRSPHIRGHVVLTANL